MEPWLLLVLDEQTVLNKAAASEKITCARQSGFGFLSANIFKLVGGCTLTRWYLRCHMIWIFLGCSIEAKRGVDKPEEFFAYGKNKISCSK